MTIYYAHHIWKYNTEIEQYEMNCIKAFFEQVEKKSNDSDITETCFIINPKDAIDQRMAENAIMNSAYKAINDCDALVFTTCSGMIGKGVFSEIIYAFNCGKKVYVFECGKCVEIKTMISFISHYILDFVFNGNDRVFALISHSL